MKKRILFRLILVVLVLFILEAIGYAGMILSNAGRDFLSNNNYFSIRDMLAGTKNSNKLPRYLTLPYLGYVPYPEYKKYGEIQHNEDGYRGRKIPLQKSNKLRVLCLGGSTTYGTGVDYPRETFSAQLERLLVAAIKADTLLSRKFDGAEVLNAGLEAGNSAEELQQYLFKYRYYKPDVVIVHSGINDAFLVHSSNKDFQLDYTHSRRINFHLEPLHQPARWMMKSYLFSFFTIKLFYQDFAKNIIEFEPQFQNTFCRWTTKNIDSVIAQKQLDYYPFYNNTKSLYAAILNDSAMLITLPPALNLKSPFVRERPKYLSTTLLNAEISKNLSQYFSSTFVPFAYDSIPNPDDWVDDCHLNANGEKDKAEILLPFVLNIKKSVVNN